MIAPSRSSRTSRFSGAEVRNTSSGEAVETHESSRFFEALDGNWRVRMSKAIPPGTPNCVTQKVLFSGYRCILPSESLTSNKRSMWIKSSPGSRSRMHRPRQLAGECEMCCVECCGNANDAGNHGFHGTGCAGRRLNHDVNQFDFGQARQLLHDPDAESTFDDRGRSSGCGCADAGRAVLATATPIRPHGRKRGQTSCR